MTKRKRMAKVNVVATRITRNPKTNGTNEACGSETVKTSTHKKQKQTSKVSLMPPHIKPATTIEELMWKNKIIGPRTLHWPTLEKLNVHTQFEKWLTPAWKRLFNITQLVYKELVNEFVSTYQFNKYVDSVTSRSAMQFSLLGKVYELSFSEFALAMKLYTTDEVDSQDFITGMTGWPSGVEPRDFWTTFGTGDFQYSLSSTSITQPCYKILHRAIAEMINQRATCTYNVTRSDLMYMYYIVHNTPCNLAKCLARYLYKSSGKKHNAAVYGGAYITQLALGLGDTTESDLLSLTELATTTYFDEAHLENLDIIENKNCSGAKKVMQRKKYLMSTVKLSKIPDSVICKMI